MIGIYKITNLKTKMAYIGQSIDINKRWLDHFYKSECQLDPSYNSPLHEDIRKSGYGNFELEVLEECEIEELDLKEIKHIKSYNSIYPNGYNVQTGGRAIREKTRRVKICKQCGINETHGGECCRACYNLNQRRVERPKAIELARLVKSVGFNKTGKLFGVSCNTIQDWCDGYGIPSHKRDLVKWYNEQTGFVEPKRKPVKVPVVQVDVQSLAEIRVFESSMDAARYLGKKKGSHITEVCKGRMFTAHGYHWKYKNSTA